MDWKPALAGACAATIGFVCNQISILTCWYYGWKRRPFSAANSATLSRSPRTGFAPLKSNSDLDWIIDRLADRTQGS